MKPRRWLDEGGLSSDARDLLESAPGPDPEARRRMWAAVQASVAASAAAGTASAATGGAVTTWFGVSAVVWKPVLAVALVAVAAGGARMATTSTATNHAPPRASAAAPVQRASAVTTVTRSSGEAPVVVPTVAPTEPVAVVPTVEVRTVAPSAVVPAVVRVHRVAVPPSVGARVLSAPDVTTAPTPVVSELESLQQAFASLRSDPRASLARLETAARQHPDGVLAHEREALAIDALARLGRTDEARQRGAAFLAAHSESTQASRVRRVVAEIVPPTAD